MHQFTNAELCEMVIAINELRHRTRLAMESPNTQPNMKRIYMRKMLRLDAIHAKLQTGFHKPMPRLQRADERQTTMWNGPVRM